MKIFLIFSFLMIIGCAQLQDLDIDPSTTVIKKLVLPKGK